MNALKLIVGTVSSVLIILGICIIVGNIVILCTNIIKKRHESFIPLVGTMLYMTGMRWNQHIEKSWYYLIPLVLDIGGIPMLLIILVEGVKNVLFKGRIRANRQNKK